LYVSPNVVGVIKRRRIILEGHIGHMGNIRNAYKILVGNPESKRPLFKSRA
jgi:hypothetical protein